VSEQSQKSRENCAASCPSSSGGVSDLFYDLHFCFFGLILIPAIVTTTTGSKIFSRNAGIFLKKQNHRNICVVEHLISSR